MNAGIDVRHARGLQIPEAGIWLDPPRPKPWALVSHAHSDHFARHDYTICSSPTMALIHARYGEPKNGELQPVEFGQSVKKDNFSIRLHPAGHILGSAMIHLTRHADGATLLYTGDFKLRDSLTCERAEPVRADTLVMETTFGLPRFRFPPRDEVIADVHRFIFETLNAGKVPVLLGYSLGKAQEILAMLDGIGVPIMAHESIVKMSAVFRQFGRVLPMHDLLDPERAAGHVVVAPPQTAKALCAKMPCRTALLSGWALEKSAKYRYGVDEAFPLSDHADHDELLQLIEQVRPRVVYTVHGYTTEFAADLRRRVIEAWSLVDNDQLELQLERA
ncbi:MAG: MBL fold metallo-hydrolase [Verrucomicrobia bacterium]|nr:MBL fold metallo-hydrolase [Verrucomicrobiota bacterium]